MRLAYLYPEHLGLEHARVLQVAATVAALAREAPVHLLVGRFAGLDRRLRDLGMSPSAGLCLEPLWMCQPGPGLPVPISWHRPFQAGAARRLRRLARRGPLVALARHLKLADHLLSRPGMPPLLYEAHELFAQTAAEEGMAGARLAGLAARERRVLAGAGRVLAISGPLARALEATGLLQSPPVVAPSGVAEKFFAVADGRREPDLVAYAGGLGPWKGVDLLLRSAARVPGARLEVLGGDPGSGDWRRLSDLAGELGLGRRLAMRPRAGQDAVRELLARATVAVWPGSGRQRIAAEFTSPLKLFEYLAAGCAVVAPRVPAARAVLAEGRDAAMFEPDDPGDLARVLAELLADPVRAAGLSQAGRETARGYTWGARARTIAAVARELAG